MMRDPEQTIGNLIDHQNTSFVGSVDEGGYPEIKAMLPPRKREGIRTFCFTSNTSSMRPRITALIRRRASTSSTGGSSAASCSRARWKCSKTRGPRS